MHNRVKGPWFFVTADYTFGHAVEADARAKLASLGEQVAGSAKVPLNTTDFSNYLIAAQASGAKVLALNVAGGNATAMKQAAEFAMAEQGMVVVPMSFQNVDIKAVGLQVAQGDLIVTSFFEDEVAGGTRVGRPILRHAERHALTDPGWRLFSRAALFASGGGQ